MNTLFEAPRDQAAPSPKRSQTNPLLETVGQVLHATNNAAGRDAAFYPVSAEDVRRITPASRWGINE